MAFDLIKYAFIAGELSPTLHGRTDLTKFDLGVSEARNFFVDYRGGLSSRPGTKFFELVKEPDKNTVMVPFAFSDENEDTHIILFGHNYIRFLQNGYYILEDPVSCSTAGGTVTATAHGLTENRWIKVNGVSYRVGDVTPNTFNIYKIPENTIESNINFSSYQAVYELVSPFGSDNIPDLNFHQYRDVVKITSFYFPVHELTRFGATNWTIAEADISPFVQGPSITSGTSSGTGTAEVIFAVSKVLEDGTESIIGNSYKLSGIVNYTATEGSVSVSWPPASDAVSYKVYRSVVSTSEVLSYGSDLGYVGRTTGTKFTDPNIVADFGKAPQKNYNPFAPGAITSITITSGGSGYTTAPSVSVSGGGSGFVGRAIVNDAGQVVNVLILNGGSGYTNPTVSFSGTGTGATATAEARALSGTYPSLSTVFQQRQIYAASLESPVTVWGSQIGRFNNFNSSDLVLASDSYEFSLDSAGVSPIRHLVATRGGLLAMTADNVWLLTGGQDKAITPTSVLADPQTYTGVSELQPIRVGSSILYTEGKGYSVRELLYNEFSRVYSGQDRSILANHLFGVGKRIIKWAFQESPYKVIWCVREDGALLAFTMVPEEDVFAWTQCYTRGKFVDVTVVREENEDRVYFTVERFVKNTWQKFVEGLDLRQFTNIEDAWCVDCGLDYALQYPEGTVTVYADETAVIEGGSFDGKEGCVLRLGGGVWDVVSASGTTAQLRMRIEPTNWVPETGDAYTFPVPSGEWSLTAPIKIVGGLDHLEGETVSILADGNVVPPQVVTDGKITLEKAASRIIIGLGFTCKAKTLPLFVPNEAVEAKRKRVVAVSARLNNSRALRIGDSYDTVYEVPERKSENPEEPIKPINGRVQIPIGTTWDEDAYTHFLLSDPLPATLLSLVRIIEVGDEGN